MGAEGAVIVHEKKSLLKSAAERFGMEPAAFMQTLKATVFPGGKGTDEQVAAFLVVSMEYNLNPFIREIFAFPTKSGGIQPIVSIDGFITMVQRHPQYDGFRFIDHFDEKGGVIATECIMFRKDFPGREFSQIAYMDEYYRETEPWQKMKKRMLRHKAFKESGRYTFGFYLPDEEEARDITGMAQEIGPRTIAMPQRKASPSEERQQQMRTEATQPVPTPTPEQASPPTGKEAAKINQTQVDALRDYATQQKIPTPAVHAKLKELGVNLFNQIPAEKFEEVLTWAKEWKA